MQFGGDTAMFNIQPIPKPMALGLFLLGSEHGSSRDPQREFHGQLSLGDVASASATFYTLPDWKPRATRSAGLFR